MEHHHASYKDLIQKALHAERRRAHRDAVEFARQAFEHVDGMMRYAEKYDDRSFDTIDAIDLVLRYSPVLLDKKSLDVVEELLKQSRRIEKKTSQSLASRLEVARKRMSQAYQMWDFLERHSEPQLTDILSAVDVDRTDATRILDDWSSLELVGLETDRVMLRTRLNAVTPAKCSFCGFVTSAPKAMLFEEITCPDCSALAAFVILSS